MSRKTATRIEWTGCSMIVLTMLFSHFVIPVADAIMLPVAIVSFILMATGMVRLKIIDAKEERNRLEGNEVEG